MYVYLAVAIAARDASHCATFSRKRFVAQTWESPQRQHLALHRLTWIYESVRQPSVSLHAIPHVQVRSMPNIYIYIYIYTYIHIHTYVVYIYIYMYYIIYIYIYMYMYIYMYIYI